MRDVRCVIIPPHAQKEYKPPRNTPEAYAESLDAQTLSRAQDLSRGVNEAHTSQNVKMQRRSSLAAIKRSKHAILERLKSDELYQDRVSKASELLDGLMELHSITQRDFVDMSFGDGRNCTMPDCARASEIAWRRPSQITFDGRGFIDDPTVPGSWSLFGESGNPHPDDVQQGAQHS